MQSSHYIPRVNNDYIKNSPYKSIAHINIDAPFQNFDTAWRMLNYIADQGVTYFAFNLRISACKNNHGFYGDTCPECGEPKVTTYQRIVGLN